MKDKDINLYAEKIRDCLIDGSDNQIYRAICLVNELFEKTCPITKQAKIEGIRKQISDYSLEKSVDEPQKYGISIEIESSTGLFTITSFNDKIVRTKEGITFSIDEIPSCDIDSLDKHIKNLINYSYKNDGLQWSFP